MVLEECPVIMAWFVLSAAYRVLFRDLMDSLVVDVRIILKWIFKQ
jgi:hypothetical protein